MAIKIAKVTAIGATTIWDASHVNLENLGTSGCQPGRVSTYLVPLNFCDCHFFRGYV